MSELLEAFSRYFEVVTVDSDELRETVFRLRYQVYCVETHFEEESAFPDEMEQDAYDSSSSHTLLRHRATGWWAGTVRLVNPSPGTPDTPYPVEDACGSIFSEEKLGAIVLPRASAAEVSRFAVSKEFRRRHKEYLSPTGVSSETEYSRRVFQASDDYHSSSQQDRRRPIADRRTRDEERAVVPHITLGLIQGLIAMSQRKEITHWVAAMEPTLLRLLTHLGIYFQNVGPTIRYHGKRQPCVTKIGSMLVTVKKQRPDVWGVLTLDGKLLPIDYPTPD